MFWIVVVPGLLHAVELPVGSAPDPVVSPHFPDRLHAFVWRNWPLVPVARMAEVVGATPEAILEVGRAMGLPEPPNITENQWHRSYITILRRNWHLLSYEQLLTLLGWSAEELAFCLREDDFLFIKLGSLKPRCEPLTYTLLTEEVRGHTQAMASVVGEFFPNGVGTTQESLFGFVSDLSADMPPQSAPQENGLFSPRFCYSYFALYGDPLMEPDLDPYPDGYLARLAATGVNGVWLQAVLYKLAPFPWDDTLSADYEVRLKRLRELVARARTRGIGIYLYLNEPRAMPLGFFEGHDDLKGVTEGDHAAMCTSAPAVQAYIRDSVSTICRGVPELAGFFTITASENLTNCWSHGQGKACARCGSRGPAEVIAGVNGLVRDGIAEAGTKTELIAWDWGWGDDWAEEAVAKLPDDVSFMSVSEWSIPIERGGVDTVVGEYSISTVGPGPRATRHWRFARTRGLKTIAKIQAGCTWEISAVPYIPALENVATHAANLREAHVDGLMLGWTLGGYPSPNLEVVAEMGVAGGPTVAEALETVAARRFGEAAGPAVVAAWRAYSAAFREFPYHGGTLYMGPMQMGPANPLWGTPTGYRSTMVGFPYDHLEGWRSVYPAEVFVGQFTKMADGFDQAIAGLKDAMRDVAMDRAQAKALASELDVAEACAIHFRSVANQARFVQARDALANAASAEEARPLVEGIESILRSEIDLAVRLHAIQSRDSRIGFEASNQYFYVPIDLVEKVVNCADLLRRWLPEERAKHGV